MTQSKQIEKSRPADIEKLLKLGVEKNIGVEQLKELMQMKYEHERRENVKAFHEAFCQMQSELPIVKKEKVVKDNSGRVVYRYAPLEKIIETIMPVLKKYKFSYRWTEENIQGGKRVVCHITGHGHTESSHVDVPIQSASKMTNQIQQAGSSSTYGKRYSLSAVLGIVVDDDDDGRMGKAPDNNTQNNNNQSRNNDITYDTVVWFGKHKGRKFRDLPYNYIEWLITTGKEKDKVAKLTKVFEQKLTHEDPKSLDEIYQKTKSEALKMIIDTERSKTIPKENLGKQLIDSVNAKLEKLGLTHQDDIKQKLGGVMPQDATIEQLKKADAGLQEEVAQYESELPFPPEEKGSDEENIFGGDE